jgi:hypothetical protein
MVLYLNSTETHKIRQDLQKEYARSITPLRVVDIDAVVYLLRKYFLRSRESFIHTLIKRMAELCFTDGKFFLNASPLVSRFVNGFSGVITNPFRYSDRMITAASFHHLMAAKEARKQLMPIRFFPGYIPEPIE